MNNSDALSSLISSQKIPALKDFLLSLAKDRPPDFILGATDNPQLLRWHIQRDVGGGKGNIYLHQILRSDEDRALHDHPWDSTSIILDGTLTEVLPCGYWDPKGVDLPDGSRQIVRSAWERTHSLELAPGAIKQRRAEEAHRLAIHHGPVWTLFITGAKRREWGFHCPAGWRHWEVFVDPHNTGLPGSGCA